jgi:1-acyl-sn-glycerol-3-phosphate acyltransferase
MKYTVGDYLRSVFSMLLFFILLTAVTPVVLFLLFISLGRLTNFIMEKIVPWLARPVLFTLGIRFRVMHHYDSLPYPAVYIFNHSSTLDLLTALATGMPAFRVVAKWQLQFNPFFFLLGRLTGQIFIRREKSDKAVETLRKAYLKIRIQNVSLMMAPEGTRKHEGIIGPFKKGPFRMALDLGYPIVPIYFEGNSRLSPGGFLVTKPGNCTAHIHNAIPTDGWDLKNLESHIEDVRSKYLNWADDEYKN